MTKNEAIARWGVEAVELARDYYETDFGKVLFAEDCTSDDDYPAIPEDQIERCTRAFRNLNNITTFPCILEYFYPESGWVGRYLNQDQVSLDVSDNFDGLDPVWVDDELHSLIKTADLNSPIGVRYFPAISYQTYEFVREFAKLIPGSYDHLIVLALDGKTDIEMRVEILKSLTEGKQ